ncbi:MAG: helix-turn-helix transcriptional regulator [Alphaproteobacteria bacterium]|nr:helix-turn-helix transcriptional regulator [Alphaproteobacteria bacterium]MCB9929757.1 helix-turn-helix transcriptional regulator [Alphaproteobacteria bacterium]
MALPFPTRTPLPWALLLLIAAQVFCAVFFGLDAVTDLFRSAESSQAEGPDWHLAIEGLAAVSLWAAIAFEVRYVLSLLRRKAQLERNVSIASAAVQDVIAAALDAWRLTASERDVANLLIKGLSIAEIAAVRGSAEGTVKAHLNAIYRKSGAGNRGDLLSLIIDQLLEHDAGTATDAVRTHGASANAAPERRDRAAV